MSLKDRIKEALEGSGMSPAEFSRAANVSQSAINQLTEGKTKSLKADTAAQIEIATGYKATWLALGKGQKKVDAPEPSVAHNITPISAHLAMAEASLESVMERVAAYLAQVPAADRGSSSAALAALAHQPEDHARKAAILRLLIDAPPLVHETATGTDQAQK